MKAGPPRSGSSTTFVLWLMILLVFVPIAAAHGLARLAHHEAAEDPAAPK